MKTVTQHFHKLLLLSFALVLLCSTPSEQHRMLKSSHPKQAKRQTGHELSNICQCNDSAMTRAQQQRTEEAISHLSNDVGTVGESVRKMQWGLLQEQQLRIFDLNAKMRAGEAAILGLEAHLEKLAANQELLLKEATRIELTLRHEPPSPKRHSGKKRFRK